jgi:hypothetical protein
VVKGERGEGAAGARRGCGQRPAPRAGRGRRVTPGLRLPRLAGVGAPLAGTASTLVASPGVWVQARRLRVPRGALARLLPRGRRELPGGDCCGAGEETAQGA